MTVALLALALGCGGKDGEGEADRTYAVDRNATKWVAPALVADELIPTDAPLLVGVSWRDDTTIDLSFGLGTGTIDHAGQDPTRVTTSLAGAALWEDGTFVFGPEDVSIVGREVAIVIEDMSVTGKFANDDAAIEDLRLTGRVDFDTLYEIFELPDVAALCDSMSDYLECRPCRDGGKRCADVDVRAEHAPEIPGLALKEEASGTLCAGVLVLPVGAMLLRRKRKATA